MAISADGEHLTIEKVVKVAREREPVEIPEENIERVRQCRKIVEDKINKQEVMYGINTGIGELSEVVLAPDQLQDFQRYLIYSHTAGYGDPVAEDDARAAMLSRLNVLCKGHSGLRVIVVQTLKEMLNRGVTPVMCQRGSVGACGDLSPLGQMALVVMGEGEAFFEGERLPGREAMTRAGVEPLVFEARDGLATINGSNLTTGMGSLQLYDARRLVKTAEIAAAMSLEALNANMTAYDERIHKARGYRGSIDCAENIRRITEGSELLKQGRKKVQDSYCMRSTPQVIGPAKETIDFAEGLFLVELNGVGDNPIFFNDDGGTCLTGANFQGTPLAFGLEFTGTAITTIAALSERRSNRLMNPHLSSGLPAFLTKGAGMFSGMMLTQYTQGALVCENRVLSHPAATGSIPAAADQEDFVSMSMTTAIKTKQIIRNAEAVVAIELMGAAQGIDFRGDIKRGKGTQAAHEIIRENVEFLDKDRPLNNDINRMANVVREGKVLEAVEKAIGALK
ncbi:histidine ammonia-lyase [Acidobacteriota bacterium]